MKSCKYVIKAVPADQFGVLPDLQPGTDCRVKLQGPLEQIEVYQRLFEKGQEGSFVSNVCPLAEAGNWSVCEFYEPT